MSEIVTIGRGLASDEAARRLVESGPNKLGELRTRDIWAIVRGTLREPMFLLLIAAACLYLVVGDIGEGLFLTAGAALTIGIVIYQEARSEGALRALRSLAQPVARVVRDGVETRINARNLVPGDLILIGDGDRLPADGRLIAGDILRVDESLLSGESAPVTKRPYRDGGEGDAEEEDSSALFAGTTIVSGGGAVHITATGARTELGKIGATLADAREEPTPLQKTAHRLVGMLAIAALGFCAVVFIVYGVIREDWLEGSLIALTVAISLLPEEFPMVLAVFLALGGWRLARHHVLVRRSAVIEALGGATMLCVDKTGTLTVNRMSLVRVWSDGKTYETGAGGNLPAAAREIIRIAALASPRRSADPMDRAIHALASKHIDLPGREPDQTWPLSPERLAVVQRWRDDSLDRVAAKGAPETIFRMCRLSDEEIARLRGVLDSFAMDGLRVLGVASADHTAFPDNPDDVTFRFGGLVAFMDPLREDAPAALAEARRAGIEVTMITGDHPATALEIARRAGINVGGGVVSGQEIDGLTASELRTRVRGGRVFARINPEQKLRLVEAFKANGEVVVMTGDGVNDGPALQAAHIGIAMGRRGTDVAREAADIVLLDDSFASIVGGIRLGRRIFANLRRALTFITAVHVPLAGMALIPVLLGWPPLFLPMHVVLLELVIDPVCALVFEAEPSEKRAMEKPPRPRDEPLFGPRQILFAGVQGLSLLVGVFVFYGWAVDQAPTEQARGAAFASLVIANLVLALSDAMGGRAGLFHRSHIPFWFISGAAILVLAATLFLAPIANLLQMAPPPPQLLGLGLVVAIVSGGWFGLFKAAGSFRQRRLTQG